MGYELIQSREPEESTVSRPMSRAKAVKSPPKEPSPEPRPALRLGGNRARASCKHPGSEVTDECKRSSRKPSVWVPRPVQNLSADSSCSSDSSSSRSSVKPVNFRRARRQNGVRHVKVVPEGGESALGSPLPSLASVLTKRRCGWITLNSDPLYVSFHDEEWGVPVHDDGKLFELLVLSQALAELSWPTILRKRETFRQMFDNFDAASVAKFSEKKIISLKSCSSPLLSELKLRAVVENARQILKVAEEFGSFSNYCWSFVNHKPVENGFRYARQVPVRTPWAEATSKDLMRRGFRCVGPTVVYSFLQTVGIVNDHLSSCFRYKECNLSNGKTDAKETTTLAEELDKGCTIEP